MKIKKRISAWANKWFFVKERDAALAICLFSAGCGVALDIALNVYRRMDSSFFLNQFSPPLSLLIRISAVFGVGFTLFFVASGVYNYWKHTR